MIKQEKISEIRDRASIVEVLSDYVTLKKTGRNYMGLCPFHAEKTPSFTVNEEKGIFHCFGCQTGGSVFQFLMQYDHLTFPEAVERIARRYGITIERTGQQQLTAERGERALLYEINHRAASHYQEILFARGEGEKALAYLRSRGVDAATARGFMLGYAPRVGSGLLALFKKAKFPLNAALRLGLVGQRGSEQFYEKFFGRLMFPIVNAGGNIVAFGGRVLDQGLPKYLNSSETPLFHKGATLYGLFQARDGIRKADRVVVVEGYLDVIALHQHGIPNVVATLGTALTVEHVRLLLRYTRNIVALFDGDEAGRKAAARSFEVFIEAGVFGQAAFLPTGEDPDSFVRRHGKVELTAVLERATPLADYYITWLEQRYGKSLEGKSQAAHDLGRLLSKIKNPFEVDLLVRRAVDCFGVREESLRRLAAAPVPHSHQSVRDKIGPSPSERADVAVHSLISLMLRFPSVLRETAKERDVRSWVGPEWSEVIDLIFAEWQEQKDVDVSRLTQRLSPETAARLTQLALEADILPETDCVKMAADCMAHLRRQHLREVERSLRIAIRAAEEQKDETAKRERMLEWQEVVRKERQLDRRRLEPKTTIR